MSGTILKGRVTEGIGGSHTVVTAVPLDALEEIDPRDVLRDIRPQDVNLYAHIANCEHICPFCHYATVKTDIGRETPPVAAYMDALWREFEFWQNRLQTPNVQSIYLGGGTPTALSEGRLLETVERLKGFSFTMPEQICVETSPLTLTHEGGAAKLSGLLHAGVNRISMGLQSFDEDILQATRHHGQDVALRAVEMLAESGVGYNIDLIQDLPNQTEDSLLRDLKFIAAFMPPQVTWYICRLHQGSIWYKASQREGGLAGRPSSDESIARRRLVHDRMAEMGYTASEGGRFLRDGGRDFYKAVRGGADSALLGLGLSAYSHGWGWFFRNSAPGSHQVNLPAYAELVNRQGHAIQSGYKMKPVDYLAAQIMTGIRSGVRLADGTKDSESARYLRDTRTQFNSLAAQGLLEQTGGVWTLTPEGRLVEEEICSLFYTPEMKQRLGQARDWWQTRP